ncbi:MAG: biopolymer transporter ExbD [Candidatus Tectomicrobia bacterium]|nr:biopolymer transporter ExbD [Candidatus Tectomicrobia bacterium]
MQFSQRRRTIPVLNVIPLIDVLMFVILFMLTSFSLYQGINVNLPQVGKSEGRQERNLVAVTITRENQVYLNDRQVGVEKLADALHSLFATNQSRVVVIRADQEVKHGKVVEVMDIAKGAGAERLAIVTQQKESR